MNADLQREVILSPRFKCTILHPHGYHAAVLPPVAKAICVLKTHPFPSDAWFHRQSGISNAFNEDLKVQARHKKNKELYGFVWVGLRGDIVLHFMSRP